MKRKTTTVIAIILLALILLLGGSFLGLLIYLDSDDSLVGVLNVLSEVFKSDVINAVIIFWVLLMPVLLVIFVVFGLMRRKRHKKVTEKWEQGVKIAIEAEAAAYRKQLQSRDGNRFTVTDNSAYISNTKYYGKINSIQDLCIAFRNFMAGNMNLYFSMSDVYEFISGLAVSKILIIQGLSGAGKTSLAYAFGEFLGNPSTVIPVQPIWKERADLLGYYNEFTKKFNETQLFKKMYEAGNSNKIYITVLDEMNIARIEYYFAEFLSLLEIPNPELRYLEVIPDKWENDPKNLKDGRLKLPENMWFIGTVNNDDSAFAISDKVYDRAMSVVLDNKVQPFDADKQDINPITFEKFQNLVKKAHAEFSMCKQSEDCLQMLDNYLVENLEITFGNRILKQIRSYVSLYMACGGKELDALDDILSKKVLRKLEYKEVPKVRDEIDGLIDFLNKTFGEYKLKRCVKYLSGLIKA